MGKLIFITGGARSGKSKYAAKLAKNISRKVLFLATGTAKDEEMKKRIEEHKKSRPTYWETVEETKDIASTLLNIKSSYKVVIIDCLTFFISNLLLDGINEKTILEEIRKIVEIILKNDYTAIVISNEVGGGIVPDNELGRKFRDTAGLANQIIAESAQQVYLVVSGIPLKIKGETL
ncbi:Bifunctional adenosylcobalamin biosynthesis protein CobP [subsurface metagenome]